MKFERQQTFQRNAELEALLQRLNQLLAPVEELTIEPFGYPIYPVIFIVGCARAGSTLLLQWLANSGVFAYPSNLLSRFFGAPFVGALIQQLLTDPTYNFNNEILDFCSDINFSSKLGKTKGALAPNEFWYFWRRFLGNGDMQHLKPLRLSPADQKKFVAEFAALEQVFNKPFVLKGHIINWNISYISQLFKKALFLYITREPVYNAQSLLEARVKFYGDRNAWYSFKPREYEQLQSLPPVEQVAGQVYFTNHAIETELAGIQASRWLNIRYEELCSSPSKIFLQIKEKLTQQTDMLSHSEYSGPTHFHTTNQKRLKSHEVQAIYDAYKNFSETLAENL